ncbi:MAG: tyrosine-type recombinase/integrase [Candidatus Kerfeldbacteria bacterium]
MTDLAPHLSAYLRERLPLERQASPHTCDTYAYAFRLLVTFAAQRLHTTPSALAIEQLDAPLILAFLEHLETVRHNRPKSRNARLAAIKAFAHFVEYRVPSSLEQVRRILAIPFKKTDEPLVCCLDRAEVQALLDAPDPRTRCGLRDRAMLHLAFAAGLRVSELVGLSVDDLGLRAEPSVHVLGKGRRERVLPLWKETAHALRAWYAVRGAALCPAFFLSMRSVPLTRAGFEYILKRHVTAAGAKQPSLAAKRVSPHVLRHTCAMHTLQATHDIRKVALWLGHASVQTTEIYLRADPHEKLEAIEAIVPPSLRRGRFKAPDHLFAMLHTKASVRSQ